MMAKIESSFPDRLKSGFLGEYRRLREAALDGDRLFDGMADFSCSKDGRLRYRAAGLAVLTYFFEICDVFET